MNEARYFANLCLQALKAQKDYFRCKVGTPEKTEALKQAKLLEEQLRLAATEIMGTTNTHSEDLYLLAKAAIEMLTRQQVFFKSQFHSEIWRQALKDCRENLEPRLRRLAKEMLDKIDNKETPTLFS